MSMNPFRDFVQLEIHLAQEALQDLLLVKDGQCSSETVVPTVQHTQLQDSPGESQNGFNLLQHTGNQEHLAVGHQWVLNHMNLIFCTDSFRLIFLDV